MSLRDVGMRKHVHQLADRQQQLWQLRNGLFDDCTFNGDLRTRPLPRYSCVRPECTRWSCTVFDEPLLGQPRWLSDEDFNERRKS